MKKLILFITLINTLFIYSQSFEWVKTPPIVFNSLPALIGYPTTCDAFGNIYVTGFTNNSYNYTEIYGDLFYNKYDNLGQLLFSKTITGKAQVYDIQSDSSGNIYVAAAYIESITIDNTTISTNLQGLRPLLLKFDSSGELLWNIEMSTFNSSINHFKSITIDSADMVYICYDNYNYSYVKKLDASGNVLLTIEQQNVNIISSVSVDNEGYIYTAGSCANSNSKFANVLVPATFSYNTYVAKYSPTGVYQWVKFVQDITCPDPQVTAKSQDEVYFSSTLNGAYSFGTIIAQGPNGGYDFFITKLNSTGTFQWVREAPGNGKAFVGKRNYLNIDATGNVYFAGSTYGTVNWENNITTVSTFYQEGLVLKYDPNGTVLMAKIAGGVDTDRFDGVTTNTLGDIFVSGIARGSSNFDAIQILEPDPYKFYPILAKINNSNLNYSQFDHETYIVYPNPTKDSFNIKNAKMYTKGEIYTILGNKIKTFEVNESPISIRELANGTYFIKIEGYKTFRLIKS